MNHILGYLADSSAPEWVEASGCGEQGAAQFPLPFGKVFASSGFAGVFSSSSSDLFEDAACMVMLSGDFRLARDERYYESVDGAGTIAGLYKQFGEGLFARSGGHYSVAIFDKRTERLFVAIDSVGFGQLYYQLRSGQPLSLLFSSSLDRLVSHPRASVRLSNQGIYNYFYFHTVPSPGTIYEGIHKLAPGQVLIATRHGAEVKTYRTREYREDNTSGFSVLEETCRQIVRDCTARYAELPGVGCFLSGGIDSSTITAFHAMQNKDPVDTFSIGFDAREYDESHYADITAKKFSTRHHRYEVTPADVLEAIERIASAYDEPFGNASAVPAYLCAKMAHDAGMTHLLAGDGGDEIFAGNERYRKQRVFDLYGFVPGPLRNGVIDPIASRFAGKGGLLGKASSYIRQAKTPLPDRLEAYNFLHREDPASIFADDFLQSLNIDEPLSLKQSVFHGARASSDLNRLLELDMKFTVADNDLRKVITTCDLAGIQVHFPLLDDALVNFAATVPSSYKLRGNTLRYFFKRSMRGILAPETLAKKKHGFGLPFGLWLRDYKPLRDFAGDHLQSFQRRNIVKKSYLDSVWNHHQDSDAVYYGVMIWLIVMLESWLQHHESARR